MLVDILADQIHAHRRADGGDVPGAQHGHHLFQRVEDGVLVDDDIGVVGPQVLGGLAGVFQVDGVTAHADGKGADGLAQLFGRNGADQAGIQPAGEQEAHGGVGIQPLFHARNELFPDVFQDGGHIVPVVGRGVGDIAVPHKPAVAVVAADGERINLLAQPHQVLGLGGKGDGAAVAVAVEQGPDADGVPGGDEPLSAGVIQHHGKLRIQVAEHVQAVLFVQRQDDLAVGIRPEGVALGFQFGPHRAEPVQLAVAHHQAAVPLKGLHALGGDAHDGQTPEAQVPELGFQHPVVVRTAGGGTQQIRGKLFAGHIMPRIAHNTTHLAALLFLPYGRMAKKLTAHSSRLFRTNRCLDPRCHLNYRMPTKAYGPFPYTFTFETLPL